MRGSRSLWFAACLLTMTLTGGSAGGLSAQSGVAELQIAPGQVEVAIGQRKSVLVTAFDRQGNVVTNVQFGWTVDNTIVAVQRDETTPNILYVEGVTSGVTAVRVRAGTVTADAQIRVVGQSAATGPVGTGEPRILRIAPANISLLPTEELQLFLYFLKDDGSPASRTAVTWRSLLETVAAVDERGVVVGISPGQGVIEVRTASGVAGRALVLVANASLGFLDPAMSVAPAGSDTVSVVVPGQGNRRIPNRQLQWASTNMAVAHVSPLGVITGIAQGSCEIIVQGFGQQHRLPVTVHPPASFLAVSPDPGNVSVPLGGFVEFSAVLTDANRNAIEGARARWQVEDESIAAFDRQTGRVMGRGPGTTRLIARGASAELRAEWVLRVVPGGVALSRSRVAVGRGEEIGLPASFVGSDGEVLGVASGLQWRSLDPTTVTVSEDGRIRGQRWGRAGVVAETPWGTADTVVVFVQGQILVTATRSGSGDIYAFDPDSLGAMNQLTSSVGAEVSPSYSPDGTAIAYVSTEDGNPEIYLADADGSNTRRLTSTPEGEGWPTWTPSGRELVFTLTREKTTHLWIMNVDGSERRQLTTGDGSFDQPAVSPDGRMIAYRATGRRSRHVYLMNVDGSNPRIFTESDGEESRPRWFPDGRLGFVSQQWVDRERVRVVMTADPATGENQRITPPGLGVTDFAVSRDGHILALVVQSREDDTLVRKLLLMTLDGPQAGTATEVPRSSPDEALLFPTFRP